MRRGTLIGLAGALVALVWLWSWWNDPARAIHARLDRLEALMSKGGPEEQIAAFGTAREVAAMFTEHAVALAAPYSGQLSGRQAITGAVMRYRTAAGGAIELVIDQREIELRENATASTTFRATVTMDFEPERGRDSFRVTANWQRDDGDWLVNHLEVLEILEGGDVRWW